MFKPCILIPVYNHADSIAAVVQRLLSMGLPCFIMDDGSEASCQAHLADIADDNSAVVLLRFEVNRGKGAVVCDGLQQAYREGYTHALQVDADGQHNLDDVAEFLERAKNNSEAVISGWRDYRQLPGPRRYGRFITDLWVWINTLSLQIKDSMCGFRLYPLAATVSLLSSQKIGMRMDFDTDILVRLYWRGVDVEHVPTHTLYSDEISSHFKMFRDNWLISKMHTRLFFGMLIRVPMLIMRQQKPKVVIFED